MTTTNKKIAEIEYLRNLRSPGWDQRVRATIIETVYGGTHAFVDAHLPIMKQISITEIAAGLDLSIEKDETK